jgi:hypothetical protein
MLRDFKNQKKNFGEIKKCLVCESLFFFSSFLVCVSLCFGSVCVCVCVWPRLSVREGGCGRLSLGEKLFEN